MLTICTLVLCSYSILNFDEFVLIYLTISIQPIHWHEWSKYNSLLIDEAMQLTVVTYFPILFYNSVQSSYTVEIQVFKVIVYETFLYD